MVDPSGAPDPPPGFPNPPRDRLELWVRVIFGALFGAFSSGVLWLRYFSEIRAKGGQSLLLTLGIYLTLYLDPYIYNLDGRSVRSS
jgi:hypothetical protein